MSRATDLGDSSWSATHGWPLRYMLYAASSRSASGRGLMVVGEQVAHGRERVAGPADDAQQHRVADHEAGAQRLRVGGDQPLERRLPPGDEPLRRLLAHHLAPLLRVVAGLGQRLL